MMMRLWLVAALVLTGCEATSPLAPSPPPPVPRATAPDPDPDAIHRQYTPFCPEGWRDRLPYCDLQL